ncbi:MAG: oxygen-insensitive NADPH nitroreductase [Oceanospirillaceae bacterium]
MNDTFKLLNSHRSIRKFTTQDIAQQTIEALVLAGQSAATSSFIQTTTVIQVNDVANRAQLATLAGNQKYVQSAPRFLVFCADMNRHKIACDLHEQTMQSGFTEQFLTASLDCALFAQNLVIAAESLGLGCVYIGGLRNNIEQVGELLELPELVYPVFGLCLGYPDQNPQVKPRLPVQAVLRQDTYHNGAENSDHTIINDQQIISEYDEQLKQYYATRSSNIKQQGWSEQISNMLNNEARPHMLSYLKSKGYLIK